jgi:hypothetical protein
VSREAGTRSEPELLELAVAQVPAQLAVDVGAVGLRGAGVRVRREHAHVVAAAPKVLDRGMPDDLVPAEVVGRVHVADREDAHRDEDMDLSP